MSMQLDLLIIINIGGVMEDLIYLALTVFFFFLALAYVRGCEKLQ